MNEIVCMPLGALAANCYIVPADDNKVIVIDPASTGEIYALLETRETELGAIIITHGHFDHFAAAAALKKRTGAPIYAPELDDEMFRDSDKCWAWFMDGVPFAPITPDHLFKDGETFTLCGVEFRVMGAPGHTAGSCLLFCDKFDCAFTGDVIFRSGIGRMDGYSGSEKMMMQSLREIKKIEHNYTLYCGHGDSTELDREKRSSPYFRF